MKEKNKEAYEGLVDMWSSFYIKKVWDLFSLDELRQEVWLAILEAENNIDESVENKMGYVTQTIKYKIMNMLFQELKHRTYGNSTPDETEVAFPEEIITSKQIINRLKKRISGIPHANFILPLMNTYTVRDISELAQEEGITLGKSAVHKIITAIRKEFDKIIEEK